VSAVLLAGVLLGVYDRLRAPSGRHVSGSGNSFRRMTDGPSRDLRSSTLDSFDGVWSNLSERLAGITRDEYLWEPAVGCWSVRAGPDGVVRVDGDRQAAPDPAPVTTIGWRLWHIGVDALDSYSDGLLGTTGAMASGTGWYLDPEPAIADMNAAYACFRNGVAARTEDEWWHPIGETFGGFGAHPLFALVLHALHEVTHHAAEVALLRDLYRVG
jgi:hypothetical protein